MLEIGRRAALLAEREAIERVLACGPSALVVKRGARGASIHTPGGARRDIASFPIVVLNVLGAGDAFASGLICGLRRGWTLEELA